MQNNKNKEEEMNGFNLLILEIAAAAAISQVVNKAQSALLSEFKRKIATPIMLFLIVMIPLIISNLGIYLTNRNDPNSVCLIAGYTLTLITLLCTVKT